MNILKEGEHEECGMNFGLMLSKTYFYVEADVQESGSDSILISINNGLVSGSFTVTDVQSYGSYILHRGLLERGDVEVDSSIKVNVDYKTRLYVAPNHSISHIMTNALQELLGDSKGKGQFCNNEKLRFDFS